MDLYSTNNDFSGLRTMEYNKELVEYHASSMHRVWYNEQTDGFEPHWHTALEIIVPIENYYDIVINEKMYHINPGDIFIIPPGIIHEIIAPNYGIRYVFLMDIDLLTKIHGFSAVSPVLSDPITLNKTANTKSFEAVYNKLHQIRDLYFGDDKFSELKIHTLATSLLIDLAQNQLNDTRIFENTRVYKQKEYAQKFSHVLDYIDKHYAEEIDLDTIAERSGFSKFHFSRLFKQYTDMTFCDYLSYRRIKAAEELLSGPDLSITEVAIQSGFPSISTFNRIFKQKHGCTPTEYRAKNTNYSSYVYKFIP